MLNEITDIVENLPVPFVHIEPVFGQILEMRFDTVGNILYSWVIERDGVNQWKFCYASREYGYELLYVFRTVEPSEWLEAIEMHNDNVVDASGAVYPDVNAVAVTQELNDMRTVMILQCTDGANDWELHLLLRFDTFGDADVALSEGSGGGDTAETEPTISTGFSVDGEEEDNLLSVPE